MQTAVQIAAVRTSDRRDGIIGMDSNRRLQIQEWVVWNPFSRPNLFPRRLSLLLCMRQDTAHNRPPEIEALETRTLFSSQILGSFAGHLPSRLPVAGTSQFTLHLTNPGRTAVTEPATIQVFASPTPTANSAEVLLTTQQQSLRIKANSAVNTRLAVPTPTTLPTGNYFLLAELNGQIITTAAVAVQSPFSSLSVSFAGLPGKPIEIDGWSAGARAAAVAVTNSGNVPLKGTVDVSLYLSADGLVDGTQSLLATVPNVNIALKPGKSKVVQLRIAVPPGTAVGGYFLIAELTAVGNLSTALPAGSSTAVSSRRVAIVTQLPVSYRQHNSGDVVVDTLGGGGYCDTSAGCVDDGTGDGIADSGGSDSADYPDISDSDVPDDSGADDSDDSDSGYSDSADDDSGN
jgi:hypothetical protein